MRNSFEEHLGSPQRAHPLQRTLNCAHFFRAIAIQSSCRQGVAMDALFCTHLGHLFPYFFTHLLYFFTLQDTLYTFSSVICPFKTSIALQSFLTNYTLVLGHCTRKRREEIFLFFQSANVWRYTPFRMLFMTELVTLERGSQGPF